MSRILVLGANSGIARETVRHLAAKKMDFILTSRNTESLESLKSDLEIRYGTNIILKKFDALDFNAHESLFSEAANIPGGIDGVLLMYGAMEDQQEAEKSFAASRHMIDVNYTSAVSLLNIAANQFEQKKKGFIAAVSSVAGDRGRQSNYIYGSTKAGLSVYLQGLRNRLHKAGVKVLTIKPGTVDTKMTYGVVENSPLLASPEKVGSDISKALYKRKEVLYTPGFWLIIMLITKLIPEKLFKRTDI